MLNQRLRWLATVPVIAVVTLLAAACSSSNDTSHSSSTSHPKASAASADARACGKLSATLAQAPSTLGKLAKHPASVQPAITALTTRLKKDAASAPAPVTKVVADFTTAVQHAAASLHTSKPNTGMITTQLTRDANRIITACKAVA